MNTQSQIAQTLCDKLIEAGLDEELAVKAVMYTVTYLYEMNGQFENNHLKWEPYYIVWSGFVWEHTPEGHAFWSDISTRIQS